MEHSFPKLTHKLVDVMQLGMKPSSSKKRRAPIAKSDIGSPQDPCHLAHMGFDHPHPSPDMVPRKIDGNTIFINKRADEMLQGVNIGDPIYVGDERSIDELGAQPPPSDFIGHSRSPNADVDSASKTMIKEPLKSHKKIAAPLPPTARTNEKPHVKTKDGQQLQLQNPVSVRKSGTEISLTLTEIDEKLQNLQAQIEQLLELKKNVVLQSEATQSSNEYSDSSPEEFTKVNVIEMDDDSTESLRPKIPAPDPPNLCEHVSNDATLPTNANTIDEVNGDFNFCRGTDDSFDESANETAVTIADSTKVFVFSKLRLPKKSKSVLTPEPSKQSSVEQSQPEMPRVDNKDLDKRSTASGSIEKPEVVDAKPVDINVPVMNVRIRKTTSSKPSSSPTKQISDTHDESAVKPVPKPRRIRPGVNPQTFNVNNDTSSQPTVNKPEETENNVIRL